MACLAFAPAAMAEDNDCITVDPVRLDENGKGTVVVNLDTYVDDYNGFQMDIYLPEGFSIEKNARGNYVFTFNKEEGVVEDHTMAPADREGFVRIIGFSLTASYILPGNHWLFKFNITAPEGYNAETDAKISNIVFGSGDTADTATDHKMPEVSFAVMPYESTSGVEDVAVETDGEEVIYNLQGIRMERPLAPGIYIINGTKTRVH